MPRAFLLILLARAAARNPSLDRRPSPGSTAVTTQPPPGDDAMERFVARYHPLVTSILSGFDRLVFRGTLIPLIRERGMQAFLWKAGVRLLDFKGFVLSTSERVKEAALRSTREAKRPVRYLESSHIDKED